MKNVIFDIGNVLAKFEPVEYFSVLMPKGHMEEVCPLVFDAIWAGIDRGDYLCETARQMHIKKYPQYREQIDCIYENWLAMMTLKEDTYAYMKECKQRGYSVYLLSNIGVECYDYLRKRCDFFDLADGMVLSFEHHCIKPDKQIYEILLTKYHLQAQECVFFDDNATNVAAACALGIQGIEFHDLKQAAHEAALW